MEAHYKKYQGHDKISDKMRNRRNVLQNNKGFI
jgi:hypothetical protein